MRLLFLLTIIFHSISSAQNVGIGTSSPAEKLDVNGNIKISGAINANGNTGQPGQVIARNSSGSMEWRSLASTEDTLAVYTATTTGAIQTFTVPSGVTKIAVEAWGGGGAGGTASPGFTGGCGGGGGGGYIKAYFSVTPNSTVNIIVGLGATATVAASASSVTASGTTISALPGTDSKFKTGFLMDTFFLGRGGHYTVSNGAFRNFSFAKGGDAEPVIYKAFPYIKLDSSVDYANDFTWGKGGNAGNSNATGGTGGQSAGGAFVIFGGALYHYSQGTPGGIPGGGGGGDRARVNNGGDGLVIIHF